MKSRQALHDVRRCTTCHSPSAVVMCCEATKCVNSSSKMELETNGWSSRFCAGHVTFVPAHGGVFAPGGVVSAPRTVPLAFAPLNCCSVPFRKQLRTPCQLQQMRRALAFPATRRREAQIAADFVEPTAAPLYFAASSLVRSHPLLLVLRLPALPPSKWLVPQATRSCRTSSQGLDQAWTT